MQHIEFFHRDHFYHNYFRQKASAPLSYFIDFFWETNFDELWEQHTGGFADLLYPNVGYTYLINLGTSFTMQLDDDKFEMKQDGFLPRFKNITCHHSVGNKIFGIKFKVSPVVFQKKINFAEYTNYIYPLAYLIDREVVQGMKQAKSFEERVQLISNYYKGIIERYSGSLKYVDIVTEILSTTSERNYTTSIEELAEQYNISTRTLQRYFESTTTISCKQALQIMRVRKAITTFLESPSTFDFKLFGYFDYSHFSKHIKQFLQQHKEAKIQSHMELLNGSGIINY